MGRERSGRRRPEGPKEKRDRGFGRTHKGSVGRELRPAMSSGGETLGPAKAKESMDEECVTGGQSRDLASSTCRVPWRTGLGAPRPASDGRSPLEASVFGSGRGGSGQSRLSGGGGGGGGTGAGAGPGAGLQVRGKEAGGGGLTTRPLRRGAAGGLETGRNGREWTATGAG